jgi:hypothetical protein
LASNGPAHNRKFARAVNSMPIPLPLLVPPASAWKEILRQIIT